MTLIAGLKCVDGIVLAADTEESTSWTRGRVRKLLTKSFSKGKTKGTPKTVVVAIAGAGSGPIIDSAVEQVFDAVEQAKASTVPQLKKIIRDALMEFYQRDVSTYPTSDPRENIIDLICAVRAANGELALFKASGPLISTVSGFTICGSGQIIQHVVEELYQPTIGVPRGVSLVLHLLNVGKRYVAGVGGDSEILTLTTEGIPIQESLKAIKIKEHHLDAFNQLIGELLLRFPDGSISTEAFSAAMEQIAKDVQALRTKQTTDLAAEIQRPTSTGMPASIVSVTGSTPTIAPDSPKRSVSRKRPGKKKSGRQAPRRPKRDH